jgi:hypothetical protein
VSPADLPRDRWTEWQPGQVLCAGGLIFALKHRRPNPLMWAAAAAGAYDPREHLETDAVFDTVEDMLDRNHNEDHHHTKEQP